EEVLRLLDADNAHPPMTLRVDLSRISASQYLTRLREAEIDAQGIQWLPSGVILAHPRAVTQLPGFEEGLVSVQDSGAQLAAGLLQLHPGMRVLEAWAAPRGKSGHLLEAAGGELDLTALDVGAERVGLINQNLERLRPTARTAVGDLTTPKSFWDGRPFERILV